MEYKDFKKAAEEKVSNIIKSIQRFESLLEERKPELIDAMKKDSNVDLIDSDLDIENQALQIIETCKSNLQALKQKLEEIVISEENIIELDEIIESYEVEFETIKTNLKIDLAGIQEEAKKTVEKIQDFNEIIEILKVKEKELVQLVRFWENNPDNTEEINKNKEESIKKLKAVKKAIELGENAIKELKVRKR